MATKRATSTASTRGWRPSNNQRATVLRRRRAFNWRSMRGLKTFDERAQCLGKERFETYERAAVVRDSMRRRRTQRNPQIYKCVYCGGYHIGGTIRR